MGILGNLFGKSKDSESTREHQVDQYKGFWDWFVTHSDSFYQILKNHEAVEEKFLNPLSDSVRPISEQIYFLVGVNNQGKAELILTSDGVIKVMPLVEELVRQAPVLPQWDFIAHKPAFEGDRYGIKMGGYDFDVEKIHFFVNESPEYPDLISLRLLYVDFKAEDKELIENGCMIFLDNFLGELEFASQVDEIELVQSAEGEELIPIGKLKDYLLWREKEFVERYKGVRKDTENDSYSGLNGTLENGKPLVGLVNNTLMEWDAKASHPWLMRIEMSYNSDNDSGMPSSGDYELMDELENQISKVLIDQDGYLNVARQTADGLREVFFACKDFRLPVRTLEEISEKYKDSSLGINYVIYRDKYWKSLDFFSAN